MSWVNELKLFIKAKRDGKYLLKKTLIYKALMLPKPGRDRFYSMICFACDACGECVAVISDYTFDIDHVTSRENCVQIADYAIQHGAVLLISTFQIKDYPCLIVDNPVKAYCKIVAEIRSHYNVKAVGVTGSIGKTTTKTFIAKVLSQKYDLHSNKHNNNDIRYTGTTVQELRRKNNCYLQEIMEGPPFGTAAPISAMVKPDISVITVVGTAHLEAFKTQERILESCLGIQEGMPEDGVLVMNGDDPFQTAADTDRKVVYYGIDNKNVDYRAINIRTDGDKIRFDILHDGAITPAEINCFGRHNVLDALAAFAVGKLASVPEQSIINGLKQYRAKGLRQNLVNFGGINVFLDCYNSSIESIKTSLEAFFSIERLPGSSRIAVIGDILEAGEKNEEIHRELGKTLAATDMDVLLFFGSATAISAEEAKKLTDKKVFHTEDRSELVNKMTGCLKKDDMLFVKGSRGTNLEYAVDRTLGTSFYEDLAGRSIFAEKYRENGTDFLIYDEHAIVVGIQNATGNITIQSSVKNYPVIAVAGGVFSNSDVISVLLPDTIESIRDNSFSGAASLEKIEFPVNTKLIGNGAFEKCTALRKAYVGNGCVHIGNRAFADCEKLEVITIPDTVGFIGNDAFINCSKLTICGKAGSYAEDYASKNNVKFVAK